MRRTIFNRIIIEQTTCTLVEAEARRSWIEIALGVVVVLVLTAAAVLGFLVPGLEAIDGDYVRFSAKFGSRRLSADEARRHGIFLISFGIGIVSIAAFAIGKLIGGRLPGRVVAAVLFLAGVAAIVVAARFEAL